MKKQPALTAPVGHNCCNSDCTSPCVQPKQQFAHTSHLLVVYEQIVRPQVRLDLSDLIKHMNSVDSAYKCMPQQRLRATSLRRAKTGIKLTQRTARTRPQAAPRDARMSLGRPWLRLSSDLSTSQPDPSRNGHHLLLIPPRHPQIIQRNAVHGKEPHCGTVLRGHVRNRRPVGQGQLRHALP